MQSSAFFITCTDGHNMPVYSWLPGTEVLAVLHIAHGMSEYGQRYAPIAEILVRQGFAVYAHDHRGHGEATGMLGYAGRDFFNKQVDDIHLLMQYYHDLYPGKNHRIKMQYIQNHIWGHLHIYQPLLRFCLTSQIVCGLV